MAKAKSASAWRNEMKNRHRRRRKLVISGVIMAKIENENGISGGNGARENCAGAGYVASSSSNGGV
jgi:hypothetical protein